MKLFVLLLILLQGFNNVIADEVIWSYDLDLLPPGWTHNEFVFEGSGAYTHIYDWHSGSEQIQTHYLQSCDATVTSECDSMIIDISQRVIINVAGDSGWGSVELMAYVNSQVYQLWERTVSVNAGAETLIDSLTIHEVLPGIAPGDPVKIYFKASGSAVWYSEVEIWWWLSNASLTAYGETYLDQSTWAGIKQLL